MKRLEENEKSYSKLEWLFYIVIFPLFFTLILTGLLLTFLGEDVIDSAIAFGHKVPGLSNILPNSKSEIEENNEENKEQSLQETLNHLEQSSSEVKLLQGEVKDKEVEIGQLKEQITLLENDLVSKQITEEERKSKLRELASIYEGMSAKKAAAIIENLTLNEASLIIGQMPKNLQSSVMASLNPETAANVTIVLKGLENAENPEMAALQERIVILMDSIDDAKSTVTVSQMVNTFTQMPANRAADLLAEMSKSNKEFQLAIKILANMNDATRSGIVAQMDTDIAKRYINTLAN